MARFKEFFSATLERSKPLLSSLMRRAKGSVANLLNDTDLLTALAEGLHSQAPFFARFFVRRKAFVRFVLTNRDKLAPLLTSAAAVAAQPASGSAE